MPDDGGEPPPAPTSNDRGGGGDNKKKKKNFRRNKSASWESKNEEIKLSTFSLNNTEKIKQSLQDIAEYVTTSWDYGHDIGQSLLRYAKVPIDEPVDPGPSPSKKDEYKWSKQMDLCIKQEAKLDENLQKAHGLLIGQCDPAMRAKVEADADYEASAKEGDAIKLLARKTEIPRADFS